MYVCVPESLSDEIFSLVAINYKNTEKNTKIKVKFEDHRNRGLFSFTLWMWAALCTESDSFFFVRTHTHTPMDFIRNLFRICKASGAVRVIQVESVKKEREIGKIALS